LVKFNKQMSLQNKTAFITGGAKGIGLAAAQIFIREGANAVIADVDIAEGEKAAAILGSRCFFIHADVSNAASVQKAVAAAKEKFGSIHYLVNNAAIIRYSNAATCSEEEWDLVMNVNLKASFLCCKYILPVMQQQQYGVVINVASAQAFISSANMVHYTTAKTALLGFTRSVAVDFAPHIRCMAVCPGTVDTPMARNAWATATNPEKVHQDSIDMHLVKRIAQPDEIGELIVYLCSDKSKFMTGQAIRIDGGLGIAVPGSVEE
jgi:NAD(P)-dependent dehydrogenase (short-subunit alcohol dehydrogenase family)